MSSSTAYLNLLFGILALQMDFIRRDALIAAMQAWVFAKQRPLADILIEQGAMSAERRTLLDALVQEHLRQHENDLHQSLAAVSSLGSARQELERIADPDGTSQPGPGLDRPAGRRPFGNAASLGRRSDFGRHALSHPAAARPRRFGRGVRGRGRTDPRSGFSLSRNLPCFKAEKFALSPDVSTSG